MKRVLPLLAVAAFGFGGTTLAVLGATSFYVATTGNDTNPGTSEQPFRSAGRAVSQVKPGDTVIFREGRYPSFEVHNLNGTPEAWITFKAHPGERVTIDRYLESKQTVLWCIHIVGRCSYLIFEGFEITNSSPLIDELRLLNVDNADDLAKWEPYSRKSADSHCNGVWINGPSTPPHPHHMIFRNLEIHHLLGWGLGGSASDVQFLDNHVYDLGRPRSGYGWYSNGDRNVYRGNIVHDCIYGFHLYGKHPLRDSVVENNIVYNCGNTRFYHMSSRTIHSGGVGLLVHTPGGNNLIRNNLLVNNRDGIRVSSPNSRVMHNTVYGSQRSGISSGSGKSVVSDDGNIVIENNIVFPNGELNAASEGPGNPLHDPGFRDPSVFDFHLRPDSPAIGQAAPLAEVPADFDGLLRPKNAARAMGAHEFIETPAMGFSLSAGEDLSVVPAAAVSTTITATRISGSAQMVRFIALGLPPDTGISFSPMSGTPPFTTQLTLAAASSTPAGTYAFIVAAIGGGTTQTSRFSLTINAAARPQHR